MGLTDYLASKYLTADAPAKSSKKRKRKEPKPGLLIEDDDLTGWNNTTADVDEDVGPTITGRSSEFRKSKASNWKTIGVAAPSNNEQAAADAILTAAVAEQTARNDATNQDDAPQVVDEDGDTGMKMSSGAGAGLQSAAAVTAAMERRKAEELRRYEADPSSSGKGAETVYRDATGRIINVAMKRAEARRQAEEAEKKKAAELEDMKGDVQRADKEKRRQDLQDAKYLGVARYADDVELNEELKDKDRWNDPAAQFLTKKKEGKSVTGKPLYQGSSAPNRYGIRPGYRWDGVDRSTGFEKEYFKKRNETQSRKDLHYQWQMDE